MEKRFYLGAKGNKVCGVEYDVDSNKPVAFGKEYASIEGISNKEQVIVNQLIELTRILDEIDTKTADSITDIFVSSFAFEVINKGWYKFWIMTGKTSTKEISKDAMKVYKAFAKAYKAKFDLIRIFELNARQNLTETQMNKLSLYSKCHVCYANYIWDKLSPKKEINMPA